MSTLLSTTIEINAPADRVWNILMDFPQYPDWNPFLRQIDGEVTVGNRITARIQPPGGKAMTFKPTVLVATPEQEFRWLGHFGFSGIFDGEHIFRIEPIGPDRVQFIQEERFSGLLAPLLLRFLGKQTLAGFTAMNQALKERAEAADPIAAESR